MRILKRLRYRSNGRLHTTPRRLNPRRYEPQAGGYTLQRVKGRLGDPITRMRRPRLRRLNPAFWH